jgi:hypothetical protein
MPARPVQLLHLIDGDVGDDDQKGEDNLKAKRLPRLLFSLTFSRKRPRYGEARPHQLDCAKARAF